MSDNKEKLIAYLNKNLSYAEADLKKIEDVETEITVLREKLTKLEIEIKLLGDKDGILADIAEIKGFIADLEKEDVVEDEIVEDEVAEENHVEECAQEEIVEPVKEESNNINFHGFN